MNIRSPLKTSLFLFTLLFALTHAQADERTEPSSLRKQQLAHLLKHDCGSCHGMTLNGGLGPALSPDSLRDKPDELLFITIQQGRPGTPMPPWKTQLSDVDIHWLIHLLRHSYTEG